MMCKDIPNIEHIIPDSHSINLNINGFNFNVSHGDDVSGNAGTPWYGIERRNNRIQAIHSAKGERIHYKVMGHFHKGSMTQDHSGEFIVNGSWKVVGLVSGLVRWFQSGFLYHYALVMILGVFVLMTYFVWLA